MYIIYSYSVIFLYSDGIVVISNEMFFCLCSDLSCFQLNPGFPSRGRSGRLKFRIEIPLCLFDQCIMVSIVTFYNIEISV